MERLTFFWARVLSPEAGGSSDSVEDGLGDCGGEHLALLKGHTQRLHSGSFLGLPYGILNISRKRKHIWNLWVGFID